MKEPYKYGIAVSLSLGMLFYLAGNLFYIIHWPLANQIKIVGCVLLILALLLIFISLLKGKK